MHNLRNISSHYPHASFQQLEELRTIAAKKNELERKVDEIEKNLEERKNASKTSVWQFLLCLLPIMLSGRIKWVSNPIEERR